MKINQIGRSMIEMLGVLAIIGVLSVGSIAGYSKAMMKYKMNKHAERFNMLLTNVLQISGSINKALPGGTTNDIFYNEFLDKAKLLPDGVVYKKENNSHLYIKKDHLRDSLGNKMSFYSRTSYGYSFGLYINIDNTSYSSDICYNIINITKEHASDIIRLLREDDTTSGIASQAIYSDCNQGTCFKNITVADITNICKVNNKNAKEAFYFYVLF